MGRMVPNPSGVFVFCADAAASAWRLNGSHGSDRLTVGWQSPGIFLFRLSCQSGKLSLYFTKNREKSDNNLISRKKCL